MPVSHLKNRVTDKLEEFAKFERSDASLLLAPILHVAEFELGLSVGESFSPSHPAESSDYVAIPEEGISLGPRGAVSIEVAEQIRVPLNLFGVIFPKGNLAHISAVSTPTTKIDPGFAGNLRLLLINHGSRRVLIKKGQPIASAVFWRTDATAPQPIVDAKANVQPRRQGEWRRLTGYLGRNRQRWQNWITLIGALAALALGIANYAFPRRPASPGPGGSAVRTADPVMKAH